MKGVRRLIILTFKMIRVRRSRLLSVFIQIFNTGVGDSLVIVPNSIQDPRNIAFRRQEVRHGILISIATYYGNVNRKENSLDKGHLGNLSMRSII